MQVDIVTIEGLGFRYNGAEVLNGVSFRCMPAITLESWGRTVPGKARWSGRCSGWRSLRPGR